MSNSALETIIERLAVLHALSLPMYQQQILEYRNRLREAEDNEVAVASRINELQGLAVELGLDEEALAPEIQNAIQKLKDDGKLVELPDSETGE